MGKKKKKKNQLSQFLIHKFEKLPNFHFFFLFYKWSQCWLTSFLFGLPTLITLQYCWGITECELVAAQVSQRLFTDCWFLNLLEDNFFLWKISHLIPSDRKFNRKYSKSHLQWRKLHIMIQLICKVYKIKVKKVENLKSWLKSSAITQSLKKLNKWNIKLQAKTNCAVSKLSANSKQVKKIHNWSPVSYQDLHPI